MNIYIPVCSKLIDGSKIEQTQESAMKQLMPIAML